MMMMDGCRKSLGGNDEDLTVKEGVILRVMDVPVGSTTRVLLPCKIFLTSSAARASTPSECRQWKMYIS